MRIPAWLKSRKSFLERTGIFMPLKLNRKKLSSAKIDAGNPVQTPDGSLMSIFQSAKLPMVTLSPQQFSFPETFLVTSAKRVDSGIINPDTGWAKRDNNKNKIKSGRFIVRLQVSNGDEAQKLVDAGMNIDGLSTIQLTIDKDIPLQKFKINETLVKPVGLVVMLGMGQFQNVDRLVLKARDCELV